MRVYGHIKCHNVIEAYELCPQRYCLQFLIMKKTKKKSEKLAGNPINNG